MISLFQIKTKKSLSFSDLILQSIVEYKTLKSRSIRAATIHNILYGIKPKKVYPYKTIVSPGMYNDYALFCF